MGVVLASIYLVFAFRRFLGNPSPTAGRPIVQIQKTI
jgi:hypothetical protein